MMTGDDNIPALKPGDPVIWRHQPTRGYGFEVRVPGTVVSVTAKRVRICVAHADGTEVERTVTQERVETDPKRPAPESEGGRS